MVKRSGAARASRHKKKYWRKGTDVEEIEDTIVSMNQERANGGLIAEKPDDDLFFVDRQPADEKNKLKTTKRQQAALDKITRNIERSDDVILPAPKAPTTKIAKLPRGNAIKARREKVLRNKNAKPVDGTATFDLWGTDLTPKVKLDNEAAAEHFLRYTKKKQPNVPSKKVQSLLPAVSVAAAGASYNPDVNDYAKYVSKLAEDEEMREEREKRIIAGNVPKKESIVTHGERALELTEGLPVDPRYGADDDNEQSEEESEKVQVQAEQVKVLTKKQKKKAAELEKEEKRRLAEKQKEKDSHNVYKAKQINKKLAAAEKEAEELRESKKRKKIIDKLTKRQKLGRGKFEEEEAPFLLQEELVGNLRQLKPQGSVLEDRVKSMQKRNMLPIAGAKNKRKLKKSLKVKVVESRAAKEVKKGTRVI